MTTLSHYDPLFEKLGYRFTSLKRLEEALTHSSASRHPEHSHNERLEFLGDRVVGLVVADLLFEAFPKSDEGDMAKRHAALVSRDALLKIAEVLNLEPFLRRSSSFDAYEVRYKRASLADACEALIAALYLESGYDKTQVIIKTLWKPLVDQVTEIPKEPKSALQEWAQGRKLGLPVYTLITKKGPEHDPVFRVQVKVGQELTGEGSASSKREAERRAADQLLSQLEKKKS
tara:strand:+ start:936 stop:1628 length:693 start_codon:yes stop_codon:yes gene_type:complete